MIVSVTKQGYNIWFTRFFLFFFLVLHFLEHFKTITLSTSLDSNLCPREA